VGELTVKKAIIARKERKNIRLVRGAPPPRKKKLPLPAILFYRKENGSTGPWTEQGEKKTKSPKERKKEGGNPRHERARRASTRWY